MMVKKDEKEELISLLGVEAARAHTAHRITLILANHQGIKYALTQEAVGIVTVKVVRLLSQEAPLTTWGITVLKVHLRTVFLTSLVVLVVTDQAISEDQEW